jgi:phosphoribosylaminoimidazolecarboxamide formyltransferase / IMP cyclohydrolase
LKKIGNALISVYNKEGLLPVLKVLEQLNVKIFSTGGTYDYITKQGFGATKVEDITDYPSILGGRVKTLHPKVFGGILARTDNESDLKDLEQYAIHTIDLLIVDLYPFAESLQQKAAHNDIIEKIDIGGISLIRAAAKNYERVLVIPSKEQYPFLLDLLEKKNGFTGIHERKLMAGQAFSLSSTYDKMIFEYFSNERNELLKYSFGESVQLRYGENPHQKACFYGDPGEVFFQHHGKQISYNNILDIDAAIRLINDFDNNTFAVIKHTNPCGVARRNNLTDAWKATLACDPVSAFGGIIVTKATIDKDLAQEIDSLFFEVILSSGYAAEALELLSKKKNRIILQFTCDLEYHEDIRSALNGLLTQDVDSIEITDQQMQCVTRKLPTAMEKKDMLFATKIVKHLKSNAIALVKNEQLIGAGMGQPNRVDAVIQALEKAKKMHFDTANAVMASDAFFPFSDSVQIAHQAGVSAIIQPGGSIRDKESLDYCNQNNIAMLFTGIRHFKH